MNKSEQGESTEFSNCFEIPCLKNHGEKTMKNPDRYRVLYAEDNEDAGFLMIVLLAYSDIEVTVRKTVAEVWDLAQKEYFDLYLLDSRFPDGDGLDLCRRLRRYSPHTPIIFYSGDAHQDAKHECLMAGADDYLIKPYFDNLDKIILRTIKLSKNSTFSISDNFSSIQEHKDTTKTGNRNRP